MKKYKIILTCLMWLLLLVGCNSKPLEEGNYQKYSSYRELQNVDNRLYQEVLVYYNYMKDLMGDNENITMQESYSVVDGSLVLGTIQMTYHEELAEGQEHLDTDLTITLIRKDRHEWELTSTETIRAFIPGEKPGYFDIWNCNMFDLLDLPDGCYDYIETEYITMIIRDGTAYRDIDLSEYVEGAEVEMRYVDGYDVELTYKEIIRLKG